MGKSPLNLPGWQEWPEEIPTVSPWRIFRVPAGGKTTLRIVSDRVVWRIVHFFGRRSSPCLLPERCVACEKNNQAREYGWYAAVLEKNAEKVVCEATHRASGYFKQAYQTYGTLRGLRAVQMRIPPEKRDGRLHVLIHMQHDGFLLPEEPDVRLIMERMWGARRSPSDGATADQLLMNEAAKRRYEQ